MIEHGWTVTRQMLIEPDRAPLGLADQSAEPPLAFMQRQAAQIVNLICDYGLVHPTDRFGD